VAKKKTTARTAPTAGKARSNGTTKTMTKKAAAPTLKIPRAEKPRSKSELYALLADHAGVTKAQVSKVFDGLAEVMAKDLSKKTGPEAFAIPGLMKVTVTRKPATKARKGRNPFTGEEMMFKAKPARNVIKVRPLKNLKDMV